MGTVSVDKLRQVVNQALESDAFAQRLFSEPDTIAKESGLSDDEKLVLKQMNREQFQVARKDASEKTTSRELSETELAGVAGGVLSYSSLLGTTTDMIIGRSITSATGGSYASLTSASCDCCKWKGGVSCSSITLPAY